jgi:hypothetical protein
MMLVSLQQASDHLRRDTAADDADVTLKIHAASGAVLNYLKDASEAFLDTAGFVPLDSNGDPIGVPYEVQAAVLLLLGDFYSNRGEDQNPNWGSQFTYLPAAVTALLYPLRMPTLR